MDIQNEPLNPTQLHSMKCPKLYGRDCRCDGYHTFDELYAHRIRLFLTLMCLQERANEEWGTKSFNKVWKSKFHSDGTMFDGWFVAGIGIEKGSQITYHLPVAVW